MAGLTVAGRTEVIIGKGLPRRLLPDNEGRTRVAVLTQAAPTGRALEVAGRLREEGLVVEVVGLPDREAAKTLEVAASVYEALARFGLARSDTIVGVGGGTVTDLAGYVAGTWLRGVEVVHVPTTLLGAIDASIGGKTGVNVAGKNLVGVFWHPTRVAIDIDQLSRLPNFLIKEGMAEAYKAGLVGDPELADLISRHGMDAPLEEVVHRSLRVKAALVDADVNESGVRAYLNFGHTIGHAIEYASSLPHGDSIGLGMMAAVVISEKLLGFERAGEVIETLRLLELPERVRGLERARVLDLLARDKKRDAGGSRMVLLTDVGEPVLTHVDEADVELGLRAIGF
ncbi:MAG TPA: 3-dehydroquinate synthase family protein [Acidimicrobiia bacterium]|nr:3-dehydroquinate synthase family protein [Acidimicrobiia bacterium]